jgi:hypothetical protein
MGDTTGSNGGNENDEREEATPESRGEMPWLKGSEAGGLGLIPSERLDACRLEKREPSFDEEVEDDAGIAVTLGLEPVFELREEGRLDTWLPLAES